MTHEECLLALARYREAQLKFLNILENPDHPSYENMWDIIKRSYKLNTTTSSFQIIYNLMTGYARKELYGSH